MSLIDHNYFFRRKSHADRKDCIWGRVTTLVRRLILDGRNFRRCVNIYKILVQEAEAMGDGGAMRDRLRNFNI